LSIFLACQNITLLKVIRAVFEITFEFQITRLLYLGTFEESPLNKKTFNGEYSPIERNIKLNYV
jgi:hypothetical protein